MVALIAPESPNIFYVQDIWDRIFVPLENLFKLFVDCISFSFYVKYKWRKCYKNFLGHIFLGVHIV